MKTANIYNSTTTENKVFANLPCRYVVAIFGFFGLGSTYCMRYCLTIAIVAMVKSKAVYRNSSHNSCGVGNATINVIIQEENDGEFYWDEATQGMILSCFSYGYLLANFFGGRIAELVGIKWTFGGGIAISALLNLITPVATRWSYQALIIIRVLEGIFEGIAYPSISCMATKWFPKNERGCLFSVMNCGTTLGFAISLPVTGFLCRFTETETSFGGWPAAFYIFGTTSIVWAVLWFTVIHENPENHPKITKKELHYIVSSRDAEGHMTQSATVPWKAIATSVPVWACVLSIFGGTWGTIQLTTDMPIYMMHLLHFDIRQNGLLSSAPHFLNIIVTIFSGFLTDFIIRKKYLERVTARKMVNSIGSFLPAACLIGITFVVCNRFLIVGLMALAIGLTAFRTVGCCVAIMDISPTFAGTIFGISNGVSQLSGILSPYLVGVLTENNQTQDRWNIVFYISAALFIAAGLVFQIFGSTDIQPWSVQTTKSNEKSKKIEITIHI